jgi:hypothetical protein
METVFYLEHGWKIVCPSGISKHPYETYPDYLADAYTRIDSEIVSFDLTGQSLAFPFTQHGQEQVHVLDLASGIRRIHIAEEWITLSVDRVKFDIPSGVVEVYLDTKEIHVLRYE